jgi:hypothetical protein
MILLLSCSLYSVYLAPLLSYQIGWAMVTVMAVTVLVNTIVATKQMIQGISKLIIKLAKLLEKRKGKKTVALRPIVVEEKD